MNILSLDVAVLLPWVALLLDVAIKGMLVLLVAAVLTLALRRRTSASTRHLVWTLAVLALLVLPVLTVALPDLAVPFLPRWGEFAAPEPQASPALPATVPETRHVFQTTPPTELAATSTEIEEAQWNGVPTPHVFPLVEVPQDLHSQPLAAVKVPDQASAAAAATALQSSQPDDVALPSTHWWAWVVPIWLLGMGGLLLPLLAGTVIITWQVRRAQRVTDAGWQALVDELREWLGIRRPVQLLRSAWSNIPVACGLLRSKIILPVDADTWPAERRRIVLLHELAHIRRGDCLTQLLARLARAIYWFNPLIWLAGRRLRIEREQACDDLVLTAGHRPSDYAQHLLDIVQNLHAVRCPSLAAVAMARRSQFEGRLLAILDPNRRRKALTRLGLLAAIVFTVAIAVPVACMQAQDHAAGDASVTTNESQKDDAAAAQSGEENDKPASVPMPAKLPKRMGTTFPVTEQGVAVLYTSSTGNLEMGWVGPGQMEQTLDDVTVKIEPAAPASQRLRVRLNDKSGRPISIGSALFKDVDKRIKQIGFDQLSYPQVGVMLPDFRLSTLQRVWQKLPYAGRGRWVLLTWGTIPNPQMVKEIWVASKAHYLRPTAPPDGRLFPLRVVDAETEEPLADAFALARVCGEDYMLAADENGVVHVPAHSSPPEDLPEGVFFFRVDVYKQGYVPYRYAVEEALPEMFTLRLPPGEVIGGVVQNEKGKPIGDAIVRAWPFFRGPEAPVFSINHLTALTDEQGRWEVCGAPKSADRLGMRITQPDYVDERSWHVERPMQQFFDKTNVQTLKTSDITVEGVIYGPHGKPLSEAKVRQGRDRFGRQYPSEYTESDGVYEFAHTPPGEMMLFVTAYNCAPQMKIIEAKCGMEPINFHLEKGNTLKLQLVGPNGPVSNVKVGIEKWRDRRSLDWHSHTDENGWLEWNEAPSDTVELRLQKGGETRLVKVQAGDEPIKIGFPHPLPKPQAPPAPQKAPLAQANGGVEDGE